MHLWAKHFWLLYRGGCFIEVQMYRFTSLGTWLGGCNNKVAVIMRWLFNRVTTILRFHCIDYLGMYIHETLVPASAKLCMLLCLYSYSQQHGSSDSLKRKEIKSFLWYQPLFGPCSRFRTLALPLETLGYILLCILGYDFLGLFQVSPISFQYL